MTRRGLRRDIVLTFMVGFGAACMLVAGCRAQAPPKVARIEKVRENLYVITGGGGTTAALVTNTGVVVVDTKLEGWGQPILDKIRSVTDQPVVMIINTHTHGDHVLGNEAFKTATEIVAHSRTAWSMKKMAAFQGANARFRPNRTFEDKLSLMSGNDRIDLYYFGRGHTDGDAWVVFPALRVVHAGDMFAAKALPLIDRFHGGSGLAYPETLTKAADGITNVDTIITGHGTVTRWDDLQQYAEFNQDLVLWAKRELRAGANVEQAAEDYRLPAKYEGYRVTRTALRSTVGALYAELLESHNMESKASHGQP